MFEFSKTEDLQINRIKEIVQDGKKINMESERLLKQLEKLIYFTIFLFGINCGLLLYRVILLIKG